MAETTTRNARGKKIKVSPGTKGAISEHIATAWLLQQGYDVFRNVSRNGRADLLALDWSTDKLIRVDVKSQGFMVGHTVRAQCDEDRVQKNFGSGIKYLVVNDDGTCEWHSGKRTEPANDNKAVELQWWRDRKTLQRFQTPGNHMSNKEWSFFCHWLVRTYPDYIVPFRTEWVREIGSRHTIQANPPIGGGEVQAG